ncbi:MAG: KH domain-containing protein [Dehalococcoidia bacterium]|nr:KH domain-containing protein [Dehalococcoidia bacterium]
MATAETSGRTIEEAIAAALQELDARRDEVQIEVVATGKAGLFGIGGEPARVRVTLADDEGEDEDEDQGEDEDDVDEGAEAPGDEDGEWEAEPAVPSPGGPEDPGEPVSILRHLLALMRIDAEVKAREPETPGDGVGHVTTVLDVDGEDLGLLIGRRGETLSSLQYVVNLILARRGPDGPVAGVDVAGYKRRREESLNGLARRMADRVRASGRTITLEPMPPSERRIVHLALAEDADVETASVGEGDFRKVALSPRRT